MRESIGNALIFNIIIIFIALAIALLVGSLSYSKAFKVKNRIIEIIEKYEKYDAQVRVEIEEMLSSIGYRVNKGGYQSCPYKEGAVIMNVLNSSYRYCIYQYDTGYKGKGRYYGVLVYMYFDIPIIDSKLEFPVYGETKIIYDI